MTLREPYIANRCGEIEVLLADAAGWASNNEKLGAHLAAYISVLITGVLEDCIEHLFVQRAGKKKDTEIQNYVGAILRQRFRNPDYGSISGLLGEFSEEYKKTFADKIAHDGMEATALQGIIGNKNSLAHVGSSNLKLTVSDVRDYYRRIIPILESLEWILA